MFLKKERKEKKFNEWKCYQWRRLWGWLPQTVGVGRGRPRQLANFHLHPGWLTLTVFSNSGVPWPSIWTGCRRLRTRSLQRRPVQTSSSDRVQRSWVRGQHQLLTEMLHTLSSPHTRRHLSYSKPALSGKSVAPFKDWGHEGWASITFLGLPRSAWLLTEVALFPMCPACHYSGEYNTRSCPMASYLVPH